MDVLPKNNTVSVATSSTGEQIWDVSSLFSQVKIQHASRSGQANASSTTPIWHVTTFQSQTTLTDGNTPLPTIDPMRNNSVLLQRQTLHQHPALLMTAHPIPTLPLHLRHITIARQFRHSRRVESTGTVNGQRDAFEPRKVWSVGRFGVGIVGFGIRVCEVY